MQDVTMPEKMRILKWLANRKKWESSFGTLPQVLHNKIAVLNGNLLPYPIEHKPCSMVGKFPLFKEINFVLKPATKATLLEKYPYFGAKFW